MLSMENIIKGKKLQMSQIFNDDGRVVPVTVIGAETELALDIENKSVVVVGTSKGKGFTGGMKKWNFRGSMATRGQSDSPRKPGSVGSQTPGRVRKGKKMAGRHGNKRVTVKGLRIVKVDLPKKELMVSGPVPGSRNSFVELRILQI